MLYTDVLPGDTDKDIRRYRAALSCGHDSEVWVHLHIRPKLEKTAMRGCCCWWQVLVGAAGLCCCNRSEDSISEVSLVLVAMFS